MFAVLVADDQPREPYGNKVRLGLSKHEDRPPLAQIWLRVWAWEFSLTSMHLIRFRCLRTSRDDSKERPGIGPALLGKQ